MSRLFPTSRATAPGPAPLAYRVTRLGVHVVEATGERFPHLGALLQHARTLGASPVCTSHAPPFTF